MKIFSTTLKSKTPGKYSIDSLVDAILNCEVGQVLPEQSNNDSNSLQNTFLDDTTNLASAIINNEVRKIQVERYSNRHGINAISIIDLEAIADINGY